MATPFDFSKSACSSIENEVLSGKLPMKDFNQFMFLRTMAYHEDTVQLADEINAKAGMPPAYVYHSMHALIQPKRNRFSKWIKPVEEFKKEVVNRVIDIFEVSTADAHQIIRRMQEEGRYEHFVEKYVERMKVK